LAERKKKSVLATRQKKNLTKLEAVIK